MQRIVQKLAIHNIDLKHFKIVIGVLTNKEYMNRFVYPMMKIRLFKMDKNFMFACKLIFVNAYNHNNFVAVWLCVIILVDFFKRIPEI